MAEKFFGVEDIKVIGLTSTKNLIVSGVSTLGVTTLTNVTAQQFNVSGVSTLGVTTLTNITGQQLNISGITTLGVTTLTNITGQQLNVSGVSTLGVTTLTNVTSQQLIVSGVSTLGVTTLTNVTSQQLIVSGISTIGNIFIEPVGTGASVGEKNPGVSGVVTFYGDGSGLRNVVAIGTGIDIQNSGVDVGSVSGINFGNNLTGNLGDGVYTVNAADAPDVPDFYWTQNSTGIHTLGNVGIGTTTANHKLIVKGTVDIDEILITHFLGEWYIPAGYTRQTSVQVGQGITNSSLGIGATRTTDAEIYNHCWDNYEAFDLDGDGIVSSSDTRMFLNYAYGAAFAGSALIGNLSNVYPYNATRTTHEEIRRHLSKYDYISDTGVSYTDTQTVLSGITTRSSTKILDVGIGVTGPGIQAGTTVTGIGTTTVTISQAVTQTETSATVYFGNGVLDVDGNKEVGALTDSSTVIKVFGKMISDSPSPEGTPPRTKEGFENYDFSNASNLNPDDGGGAQFRAFRGVGIGTTVLANDDKYVFQVVGKSKFDGGLNISGVSTFDGSLTVKGDIKGTADNADRSIFSSFADYASHSETSNGSYNLVGIGSTYSQVGILTGSHADDDNDRFGRSVATSADGKTIIVSAYQDEHPDNSDKSGLVYVYDRVGTTFTEVGILTGTYASDAYDRFGYSVATSADGKTIIVGAYGDELPDSGSASGLVYVFDREGNDFTEVGILTGSYSGSNDDFGSRIACSADGNIIVVGAKDDNLPGSADDSGLVYVFDREGNDFTEVGILTGSHADDENDEFGYSVACSADGNTIIVGARDDNLPGSADDSGVVYVYDRVGTTFNEVGILTGSHADDENDEFGYSVACSADGNTIIVGTGTDKINDGDGNGLVYVFDREYSVGIGTTFTQVGILTGSVTGNGNDFGKYLACSADGNIIVVGTPEGPVTTVPNTGLVYVFNRQGNNFNEVGILTGTYSYDGIDDKFGSAVACSADGKHIIVGAYEDELPGSDTDYGLVYVFDQDTKETPLIRVGVDNELFIDGNISIADTTSNAGGARYISTEAPSAGIGTEGDIWYDISSTGDSFGTSGNIPIGGIIMWYGSVANIPTSWRLCDGQSHSTAIGTIQTPDLRGQFVVGAADDSVEGTFSNNVGVGSTGGSADAVIVEHEHTAGTLSGSFNMWPTGEGYSNSPRNVGGETSNTSGAISVTISGNTGSVGVGSTNANLPPYYALAYIMRVV